MNKFILDSYAWIEYLEGSEQGKIVEALLKQQNEIYTHTICVAEVISRMKRKGSNPDVAYEAMNIQSIIVTTDITFSKEVGLLHAEMRKKMPDFGLADTFVLLFSQKEQATIVTGDPHFKDMKNVIFL